MKIVANCMFMQKNTLGGMETATVALLRALAGADNGNSYVILCGSGNSHYFSDFNQPNITVEALPVETESRPRRILYEQFLLPTVIQKWKPDLFYGPAHVLPLRIGLPCVLTVHDLHWMNLKDTPISKKIYLNYFLVKSMLKAGRIVADSEFTKTDILEKFPAVSPSVIDVAYIGIDDRFQCGCEGGSEGSEGSDAGTLSIYGIKRPYLLNVGQQHKRKNIPLLMKSFAGLETETRARYQLVLVGGPGDESTDLHKLALELGIIDNVIFTGIVPNESLPALYRCADLFIYPSMWEGFGMPVAEAMASGTMVICSNNSSLVEVGGDSCVLVEPKLSRLTEAMREGIADSERRRRIAESGRERSKLFSWKRTAEIYLETFEKAVAVRKNQ